jgi:hypothetical protein
MIDFKLVEETAGYVTNEEPSNTSPKFLIAGSQNVLIDQQKKVKIRSGYSRLGAENTALTQVRNAWTWMVSRKYEAENATTTQVLSQRFYDDELEVYLGTVDGYAINAWTRVANGWSTTKHLRTASWFDTTEKKDLQIMVNGDDKLYEWGGGVAVVASVTSNTVTKQGTNTFAQNNFYSTRNMTFVCVRTGTEYTYTGGASTTTLTGIADTTGLQANDILIQKVITTDNKPEDGYTNDFITTFRNQIVLGSETDGRVFISKDDDYDDFTKASPRIPGDGETITLEETARGFIILGEYLITFAGRESAYKSKFEQLAIGSTLCETVQTTKLNMGVNQGALCQEAIVPLGNAFAYLTNEVALRIISNPEDLTGVNPKTLSTPIKPDFDAEKWWNSSHIPDVFGIWYKNMLIFSLPQASHLYILNYTEDADGKLWRYWNPPQIFPVGPMSIIDLNDGNGGRLYGHSNGVPESYLLFDGASDGVYSGIASADKLPIEAKAVFAYNNFGKKGMLKNFDEYYVDGEITPNTTDLIMTLDYDYDGQTQKIEKNIDGSDEDILEGSIGFNSLAQQSLALNPLGGLLNPPADARRFRAVYEIAKEDFFELRVTFSTNEVDRYWAIINHGSNIELSKRKPINIFK